MRKAKGLLVTLTGLALLAAAGGAAYADPGANNGNGNANNGKGKPAASATAAPSASAAPANSGGNAASNGAAANGGGAEAKGSNGANGNKGTVKVHEYGVTKHGSATGTADEHDPANDPKVCNYMVHGFSFDAGQNGTVWITPHNWTKPPEGGNEESAARAAGAQTATWTAAANGEWEVGPFNGRQQVQQASAAGVNNASHFKVFWRTTQKNDGSWHYKHKVFKIECAEQAAPTPTPTPVPTPTPTPGGTPNATPTPTPIVGGQQQTPSQTVVQQPTNVLGIENLPSTSTDDATGPLAIAGVFLVATGALLLRRSEAEIAR